MTATETFRRKTERPAFSDRVIERERYGLAGSVRRAQQARIALWRAGRLTAKREQAR